MTFLLAILFEFIAFFSIWKPFPFQWHILVRTLTMWFSFCLIEWLFICFAFRSFVRLFVCLFCVSFVCSFVRLFICFAFRSFVRLFVCFLCFAPDLLPLMDDTHLLLLNPHLSQFWDENLAWLKYKNFSALFSKHIFGNISNFS
jgi:hypothetical protein